MDNSIGSKATKVVFGLEAQGHIPTIEAEIKRWNDSYKAHFPDDREPDMEYDVDVWRGIGRLIGWDPFSAAMSYFRYLNKRRKESGPTSVKWNAVSDSPPSTMGDCLCLDVDGKVFIGSYHHPFDSGLRTFNRWVINRWIVQPDVTHWIEIPKLNQ